MSALIQFAKVRLQRSPAPVPRSLHESQTQTACQRQPAREICLVACHLSLGTAYRILNVESAILARAAEED